MSARRIPAMFTGGFCKACSSALSVGSKKLMPLTVLSSTLRGLVSRSSARTPAEKSSRADRWQLRELQNRLGLGGSLGGQDHR